jgi:uncharacterized membrane protein YphA (DoxX/SURF4 family)
MFAVGWSHLSAALLLISGGTKLVDPDPTTGAMRAAGLPASRWVTAALGLWEIFAGSLALTFGGTVGGSALFVTYAGFAGFIGYALKNRLPIQSCGCFGRVDTPPSAAHVGVNLIAALSGLWLVFAGGGDLVTTLADQPLSGVPYVGFIAAGVYGLYLLLAELPRTLSLTGART